jgi:hypothetical protein
MLERERESQTKLAEKVAAIEVFYCFIRRVCKQLSDRLLAYLENTEGKLPAACE